MISSEEVERTIADDLLGDDDVDGAGVDLVLLVSCSQQTGALDVDRVGHQHLDGSGRVVGELEFSIDSEFFQLGEVGVE